MILINTWAPGESAVMREVPGFKPPAAPAGLVSEHDLKKKRILILHLIPERWIVSVFAELISKPLSTAEYARGC